MIVLPSSFDPDVEPVRRALSRTSAVVFARERESYERIRPLCDARLAHDCALYFDFAPYQRNGIGVLQAFRTDKESRLLSSGVPLPGANRDISSELTSLDAWLDAIAGVDTVRTDRAHVLIAAAMLGKQVEIVPSSYYKVTAIARHSLPGVPDPVPRRRGRRSVIAGISIVRDEGDVIGITLAHHVREGYGLLLVVDNNSTDDTRSVLRAAAAADERIVWFRDSSEAFHQADVLTGLADEAVKRGATWIVPFDADELWHGERGGVAGALAHRDEAALEVDVMNYVQRRAQTALTPDALIGVTHRIAHPVGPPGSPEHVDAGSISYVEMEYPTKWIRRAQPDIAITPATTQSTMSTGRPTRSETSAACTSPCELATSSRRRRSTAGGLPRRATLRYTAGTCSASPVWRRRERSIANGRGTATTTASCARPTGKSLSSYRTRLCATSLPRLCRIRVGGADSRACAHASPNTHTKWCQARRARRRCAK